MLDFLIKRGLFPSFSFPLDVCNFQVIGSEVDPKTGWAAERVFAKTGQDMSVALNGFVPGNFITINKVTYLSEALAFNIPPKGEPIHHARPLFDHPELTDEEREKRKKEWTYYHYCEDCDAVFDNAKIVGEDGEETVRHCPICKAEGHDVEIQSCRYIKPEAFAPLIIPHRNNGESGRGSKMKLNHARGYMKAEDQTRQTGLSRRHRSRPRLPTPMLGSSDDPGEDYFSKFWGGEGTNWKHLEAWKVQNDQKKGDGIELIMVNTGNLAEHNGWRICKNCGKVALSEKELSGQNQLHYRPYGITQDRLAAEVSKDSDEWESLNNERQSMCSADWSEPIMFGFKFHTDMIILRLKLVSPLNLENLSKSPAVKSAIISFKEAFVTEATKRLKLVEREISAGYRHLVKAREAPGAGEENNDNFVDIFLFDSVSGGAGLVDVLSKDPEHIDEILVKVRQRLGGEKCSEGNPCNRACIGCLLDFRNQMEHDSMNRIHGLQLFDYLKDGTPPNPDCWVTDDISNQIGSQRNRAIDLLSNVESQYYDISSVTLGSLIEDIDEEFQNLPILSIKDRNDSSKQWKVHLQSILCNPRSESILPDGSWRRLTNPVEEGNEKQFVCAPLELVLDSPGPFVEWLNRRPEEDDSDFEFDDDEID